MIIEKNSKLYTVTEYGKKWKVSIKNGKLSVSYDVAKDICSSFEELREYILKSDLF